jgi:hypothetical protein
MTRIFGGLNKPKRGSCCNAFKTGLIKFTKDTAS